MSCPWKTKKSHQHWPPLCRVLPPSTQVTVVVWPLKHTASPTAGLITFWQFFWRNTWRQLSLWPLAFVSIHLCGWRFLFQAPLGLSLASAGEEMIFLRRALGEEPGAGRDIKHQRSTDRETSTRACHQSYNSSRTHCWSPGYQRLLSWLLITFCRKNSRSVFRWKFNYDSSVWGSESKF